MSTFKIPVSSIGETGYAFDACAPVKEIQPPDTDALPMLDVTVNGRFTILGDTYLFRGTIRGSFSASCYRCLAPAQVDVALNVTWVFRQGESHNYEEINHDDVADRTHESVDSREKKPHRMVQDTEIDLAPYIWEELVFAQPSRFICKEDCKGLCSGCGANLNVDVCTCSEEGSPKQEGTTGLASLAALFPELVPEHKKE